MDLCPIQWLNNLKKSLQSAVCNGGLHCILDYVLTYGFTHLICYLYYFLRNLASILEFGFHLYSKAHYFKIIVVELLRSSLSVVTRKTKQYFPFFHSFTSSSYCFIHFSKLLLSLLMLVLYGRCN